MLNLNEKIINTRQIWAANRFLMETQYIRTKKVGGKNRVYWMILSWMIKTFGWSMQKIGYYERGVQNAKDLVFREIPLYFPNLPSNFDGFKILHLSDLHVDSIPHTGLRILEVLEGRTVDLCVLTGDYRVAWHGPFSHIIQELEQLITGIQSKHGVIGILGNHDECHMVDPLEKIGIRMLINENCWIEKNQQQIQLIGTDDAHFYYTHQALHALEKANNAFSIALIHSPELYEQAAEMGTDLYLCGHTHGGQICWPGGFPIVTHLKRGKSFFQGWWRYQNMQGFTHSGIGATGLPIRYNTRGEVVILKLCKGAVKNF